MLKEKRVRLITVAVGDHKRQGIVERFNRTIEGMISKYQESRNTNKYIDVLDDLVFNYNNSSHRSIDNTPQNMHNKNPSEGTIATYTKYTNINIGDKVRILLDKKTFNKGYEPKFTKSIYKVIRGNGYSFQIESTEGITMKPIYKYYQLQKIDETLVFQEQSGLRISPMTLKERKNKREITSLEEYTLPPSNKKRR